MSGVQKKILVIGSIGMDFVTFMKAMPAPGETIKGVRFQTNPGGKGNNQAIAAALSGGKTTFVGAVGDEPNGKILEQVLKDKGVEPRLKVVPNETCQSATILIDEKGENRIVIVPGANDCLLKSDIDANSKLIDENDIIVFQLETPLPTVEYAVDYAYKKNKIIILNPAPGAKLPADLLKKVTYLTPNETELEKLTDMNTSTNEGILKAGKKLVDLGVKNLLVTIGKQGVYYMTKETQEIIPSFAVNPIDTTAAGDCFNGVFATSLSKGLKIKEAVRYANLAASICVTRRGAVPSLPTREEIEDKKKSIKDY